MITQTLSRLLGVLALFALTGCTAVQKSGQIYNTVNRPGSPADLVEQLSRHDYVILGEKHDNPAHHQLQLDILKGLYERGWLKQISMEMLTMSQQSRVDRAVQRRTTNANGLEQALEWQKGWDWELYGPIVSWAVSQGIPLKAANLDKSERNTVRNQNRLVAEPVGQPGLDTHRNQLRESHCGHIDKSRQESMLRVQVARDARMAASLLSIESGSVLLAGNWHARKDIGVPKYVLASVPGARIQTVGIIERPVDDSQNLDEQYDIVWITEGLKRPDYCEMFRNRPLKKP